MVLKSLEFQHQKECISFDLSFFILSFSTLFTLINPIGIMPIVLSLTEDLENGTYNKIILNLHYLLLLY